MVVTFGDKPAKVIETSENLLTVTCPPRNFEGPVDVTVYNKYPHDQLICEKPVSFLYKKCE